MLGPIAYDFILAYDAGRLTIGGEALEVWDRLAAADWPGAGPSAIMLRRTMEERDRAGQSERATF